MTLKINVIISDRYSNVYIDITTFIVFKVYILSQTLPLNLPISENPLHFIIFKNLIQYDL